MKSAALALVMAAGCGGPTRLVRAHPAACDLRATANEITCDAKPYATLKTFFCFGDVCHGVAVVYESSGHVAWLFRGPGFDDAIARGDWVNVADSEVKLLNVARGVTLSSDGRTVRFWSMFSYYVYDVPEGVLRKE